MTYIFQATIFLIIVFSPILGQAQLLSKNNENKVLYSLAALYQKSNISEPYGTKAYYSEYAKINGKYNSFTDAAGLLLSFGNDCSIPPNSLIFASINMRKSDRSEEWLRFLVEKY